ncbi:TIGR04290 family methyltransferase [Hansschlegelia beijingensis]|uniref:tRNA (Mo5U34)-methyltransferase n=1 Tax=Hansschlegelia beijingensis TaxID=1133344 RepID=A0A7W6CWV9_9HYPH|nr:TIGR04290 family methyltransferase [Hansschlegelia beijingensis]MBB3972608.1 tRNA (mo5U34)-methyltransferase [Hansschlegelia beijingensis]
MSPGDAGPRAVEDIRRRVAELGPWFHNLDLNGIETAPGHFLGNHPSDKWSRFAHALPDDLNGASVLDIGCNAGFHSFEMKRRGAGRVLGVDHDERYLAQAQFAAEILGFDVTFRQLSVYDVAALGERFDVVVFMGVLYHLRHPLLALDLIHEHVAGDMLLFQTLQRGTDEVHQVKSDYEFSEGEFDAEGYPLAYFVEHAYAGDPSNWWIPNRAGSEAMLRAAGFEIVSRPEPDTFICRRGASPWQGAVYPARGAAR